MEKISFIGGGNMATSLIGGLIADGTPRSAIAVADPDERRHSALRDAFAIAVESDNDRVTAGADTVVLAVKPQVLPEVVSDMSASLRRHTPLIVSVAAGVKEPDIRRWSGYDASIVRTMPNTPALVGEGATALFANPFVTRTQRDEAERIMSSVGLTAWVEQRGLAGCDYGFVRKRSRVLFPIVGADDQDRDKHGAGPATRRTIRTPDHARCGHDGRRQRRGAGDA